jgi:hypothetical protein
MPGTKKLLRNLSKDRSHLRGLCGGHWRGPSWFRRRKTTPQAHFCFGHTNFVYPLYIADRPQKHKISMWILHVHGVMESLLLYCAPAAPAFLSILASVPPPTPVHPKRFKTRRLQPVTRALRSLPARGAMPHHHPSVLARPHPRVNGAYTGAARCAHESPAAARPHSQPQDLRFSCTSGSSLFSLPLALPGGLPALRCFPCQPVPA